MRILFITGSFPPMRCGVGDYTYCLATSLSRKIETSVLTMSSASESNIFTVLPIVNSWNLKSILHIIKIIIQWKPDIIHIQYPTQGYKGSRLPCLLPIISYIFGKKVIQTWHEGYTLKNILWFLCVSVAPSTIIVLRKNYESYLPKIFNLIISKKKRAYIPLGSNIAIPILSEVEKKHFRSMYAPLHRRLIIFFGFVYEYKRVELLFDISNPETDEIIIAGEIESNSKYSIFLKNIITTSKWNNHVKITGFLPADQVGKLLLVADAIVLPFSNGAHESNTSINAAIKSGNFVLTTSQHHVGYQAEQNIYYAKINDTQEMKDALNSYYKVKRTPNFNDDWENISDKHILLYNSLLK